MRRVSHFALGALLVLGLAAGAGAQQSTEMYVPIGQSPGVSGVSSEVGRVVAYEEATRTLVFRAAAGERRAELTDGTRIWLDRSGTASPSRSGSAADCRSGARVEVRYAYDGATRTTRAVWVKVESVR
jgi:hypothetical protein